jgi:hypothetical protein
MLRLTSATIRHAAGAVLVAVAGIAPAAAQRTPLAFEVVVESPSTIQSALRQLTRAGFACAAVARPSGPVLSTNIAVVMSRRTPASEAPLATRAADVKVVHATAGTVEEVERALNAGAADGYSPCGLTLTAPVYRESTAYSVVAVLARTSAEPTGKAYRVVRSRSRREDWTLLERAAADGFIVSRLASRPDPTPANTSEIVFLAEKTPETKATRYELAFAGNGPALEKEIAKAVKSGHCALAAWATAERMSVLLARPLDGTCTTPHEYEIEESSRFTVNAADGELLALYRVKDGTMGLYDGRNRAIEYSTVEGTLVDPFERIYNPTREHRELRDKIDADGSRGYQIFDITWRDAGLRGARAVDVILSRPRQ